MMVKYYRYRHGSQSKDFAVLAPINYVLGSSIILKIQTRNKKVYEFKSGGKSLFINNVIIYILKNGRPRHPHRNFQNLWWLVCQLIMLPVWLTQGFPVWTISLDYRGLDPLWLWGRRKGLSEWDKGPKEQEAAEVMWGWGQEKRNSSGFQKLDKTNTQMLPETPEK